MGAKFAFESQEAGPEYVTCVNPSVSSALTGLEWQEACPFLEHIIDDLY